MARASLTEQFELQGVVDFDNLAEIREIGDARIKVRSDDLLISLKGLMEANSVTVALLIAWLRSANNQGISIVYMDVPQELRNIIDFSGLTQVLPIDPG
jgi:anti-anti-sigma factor